MQFDVSNVCRTCDRAEVQEKIAKQLHTKPFTELNQGKIVNFDVFLFRAPPGEWSIHGGHGKLVLPTPQIGEAFMSKFMGNAAPKRVIVGGERLKFTKSRKQPEEGLVEYLRRVAYISPEETEEKRKPLTDLLPVEYLQFGQLCRDESFSIEHDVYLGGNQGRSEHDTREPDGWLAFDVERSIVRIGNCFNNVLIHSFNVLDLLADSKSKSLTIVLKFPPIYEGSDPKTEDLRLRLPSFERETPRRTENAYTVKIGYRTETSTPKVVQGPTRGAIEPAKHKKEIPGLNKSTPAKANGGPAKAAHTPGKSSAKPHHANDESVDVEKRRSHLRLAPFISKVLRITFQNTENLDTFAQFSERLHLPEVRYISMTFVRKGLFATSVIKKFQKWLLEEPMQIAFQLEALTLKQIVNPVELLGLKEIIKDLAGTARGSTEHAAESLRKFGEELQRIDRVSVFGSSQVDLAKLLKRCFDLVYNCKPLGARYTQRTWSRIMHVIVTPSAYIYEGPFEEQSSKLTMSKYMIQALNLRSDRILRRYGHDENFVRVAFADEDKLKYRFERNVNWMEFLDYRVGAVLRNGLKIAGRHFTFLGYSMSSLRSRSVWFVREHTADDGMTRITAELIRSQIGDLSKVEHSPARYGARLAQAFTGTEKSVKLKANQIVRIADIERNGFCFTDGAARISPELALEAWQALNRGKPELSGPPPGAYQFRLAGFKGVAAVDTSLTGSVIYIRQSCDKFDAQDSLDLEIAQAFDRQRNLHLNRPLISILNARGVPTQVFLDLQTQAVKELSDMTKSLKKASRLLETHGLGNSFKVVKALRYMSLIVGPEELGSFLNSGDLFSNLVKQCLAASMIHIRRDIKEKARIPVPQSSLAVGVPDDSGRLGADEVYCCIRHQDANQWYKGPVLAFRSPVVHPGDVQIAWAVGEIQDPFFQARTNTIIFSTQGARPLCNMLAGGDLDGDEYAIVAYPDLIPPQGQKRYVPPANYPPADDLVLDRKCDNRDVIDFVLRFFYSDVLGMIANRHILIADQSNQGPWDPKCMKLAELHTQAVDAPKTGKIPPIEEIPRRLFHVNPDWFRPEGEANPNAISEYYLSNKALGHLYRSIGDVTRLPDELSEEKLKLSSDKSEIMATSNEHMDPVDSLNDNLDIMAISASPDSTANSTSFSLRATLAEILRERGFAIDNIDPLIRGLAAQLFNTFSSEFRHIAFDNSAMMGRGGTELTEAECLLGTISNSFVPFRHRTQMIERINSQTEELVRSIEFEFAKDTSHQIYLAWAIWCLPDRDLFGLQALRLIAFRHIMDIIH